MTADNNTLHQAGQPNLTMSKDFLLFVPLLGTALAITFDVGYFGGIDINFFTFFSLSEHVVFALIDLPFALISAFVLGAFIYFIRPITKETRKDTFVKFILLPILLLVGFAFVFAFKFYTLTAASFISGFLFIFGIETKNLLGRLACVCAAATLLTFALGYGLATFYLYPPAVLKQFAPPLATIETKTDGKIDALILRSGDRGVLFFDAKNQHVTLLKWDEIKQISTARVP